MVLEVGKSSLVVMDMQEKIYPKMAENKQLLKSIRDLLKISGIMSIPSMMTEQNPTALGSTIFDVRELVSSAEVFDKSTFSAYRSESFVNRMELLKNKGCTQVILCGIEEHICVMQTAMDLKANGFIPIVAADCCSSRTLHSKQMAEMRMMTLGIEMLTNEMIAYEWLKDYKDERFKAVLEIVK